MVTSGRSVRSRSGSRGFATAVAAARSTSAGNSGVTSSSRWISAMPSRRTCGGTPSSAGRTRTTRLLDIRSNLSLRPVLILLPPSEGKTAPRRGKPLDLGGLSSPSLIAPRERVLDALVDLCSGDPATAAAVLEVPRTRLDLVELNASLRTAPTARADGVYAGVLYDALGLGTLSAAARRRATARLRVTSSLFGLVSPSDRIPTYRLSGDAVLPGLGTVAGVWRDALGPVVTGLVGDGLLVDLRSGMYTAFWRPTATPLAERGPVATVRVLHEVSGRRQVVSHFNKATKGRIVRGLLEDGANPRTPARLAEALRDLGWTVEVADGARGVSQLDVVVSDL